MSWVCLNVRPIEPKKHVLLPTGAGSNDVGLPGQRGPGDNPRCKP